MGDPRRFDVFADEIKRRWPDRSLRIADVAGGKGGLHAALWRRGYKRVLTFDTRHKKAHRPYYRHGLFTESTRIREGCDLVVAMHPDEATDVAMAWANKRGVPFAVVPCCARPTVWPFDGADRDYDDWVEHLRSHAYADMHTLPMKGRNLLLVNR